MKMLLFSSLSVPTFSLVFLLLVVLFCILCYRSGDNQAVLVGMA